MREWIAAAGVLALSSAAGRHDDFGPRSKWRSKAKRPKTAAQIKRAKCQKAQRLARRRSRK